MIGDKKKQKGEAHLACRVVHVWCLLQRNVGNCDKMHQDSYRGKVIQLLSDIAYFIFSLKAPWVVSVLEMDPPYCLSVLLRGQRLYKINAPIKDGGCYNSFM
jgi:hypothetical protein